VTTIVVGMEDSESSGPVVDWAVGAALVMDAELVLATVVGDEVTAEAHEGLERALSAAGGTDRHRIAVVQGDARTALGELAAAEDAALVVVGAGDAEWFPALHLGSVSHYLVHHAQRPVCVVPIAHGEFEPSTVVVGLDGSPASAAAVDWARDLALRANSQVLAVHAWEPTVSRIRRADTGMERDEAEENCRAWSRALAEAGVPTEVRVEEGVPARLLVEVTKSSGAGVLVIGSRGAGGFEGLSVGSVALNVLQHAPVPTVVVPASP
jgi:nucleotide-binding universal stress UspA family protein